eukprot:1122497_1
MVALIYLNLTTICSHLQKKIYILVFIPFSFTLQNPIKTLSLHCHQIRYTRPTDGGVRMVFIDWDEFDDASAQRAFNIVADIWMECHRDNKKIQDVPYKFPKFPVDLIQQVGRSFVDSIQQIEAPDPPVIQAASSSAAPPPRPMQDLHLLIVKMDKLSCVCDDMSIIIHQL